MVTKAQKVIAQQQFSIANKLLKEEYLPKLASVPLRNTEGYYSDEYKALVTEMANKHLALFCNYLIASGNPRNNKT